MLPVQFNKGKQTEMEKKESCVSFGECRGGGGEELPLHCSHRTEGQNGPNNVDKIMVSDILSPVTYKAFMSGSLGCVCVCVFK